jgi:hypothetical protein
MAAATEAPVVVPFQNPSQIIPDAITPPRKRLNRNKTPGRRDIVLNIARQKVVRRNLDKDDIYPPPVWDLIDNQDI